ncbi:MAG: Dabb family protein [Anaerolineaceae bacterium]|nr:Dabb family protein [Anaerolineaceae bacterium]
MSIQRIVCFKFKPGVSNEAVQQHMQDFAAMKSAIPQILDYRGGRTLPGDNNQAPDFDVMHYLVYASMEDIDLYIPHEAHQRFIARNHASWEKVLVLNSEID